MSNDKLSVIMHTLARYDCMHDVLCCLQRQTIQPDEIVIADQTPLSERPIGFYEQFADLPLHVIDLDKPSHAPAQNLAAKASSGELLLFLDDDIEFADDFIELYLEVMKTENVDLVYGAISDEKNLPDVYERDLRRADPLAYFFKSPQCKWNGMILITSGASALVKRHYFDAVGGYDEKTPRMADLELGFRLYKQGAKLYYSEKPFAHHKRWSSGGTRASQGHLPYVRLVSRFYFYLKHFPGWTTKQFVLHELISALMFREFVNGKFRKRNLLYPFFPIVRIYKVWKAYAEAKQLLQN